MMDLLNTNMNYLDKKGYRVIWDEIYRHWDCRMNNYYMTTLLNSDKILHLKRPVKNVHINNIRGYGWIRLEDYKNNEFRNCGEFVDSKGLQHTSYLIWQAIYDDNHFNEVPHEPDLTKKEDKVRDELAAIFIGAVAHDIYDNRRNMDDSWRGPGYRLISKIQIIINQVHNIKWHHAVTSTLPINTQTEIFKCPKDYRELLEVIIHVSLINMACYRPVVIHKCKEISIN